jgi:hypothetical protein
MVTEQPDGESRSELARVEGEIAALREQVRDLRERSGDESDPADRGELITAAQEQEEVLAELEARRDDLQRRLAT